MMSQQGISERTSRACAEAARDRGSLAVCDGAPRGLRQHSGARRRDGRAGKPCARRSGAGCDAMPRAHLVLRQHLHQCASTRSNCRRHACRGQSKDGWRTRLFVGLVDTSNNGGSAVSWRVFALRTFFYFLK